MHSHMRMCTGEHDSDGTSTEASPVAAQTDALDPVRIGGFQADYLGQDEGEDDGSTNTVQVPEAPVKESCSMAEPRVLRYVRASVLVCFASSAHGDGCKSFIWETATGTVQGNHFDIAKGPGS
jgi:hypothetical protein